MLKIVVQPVSLAEGPKGPIQKVYRVDLYPNAWSYTSGSYAWTNRGAAEREAAMLSLSYPEASLILNRGA